MKKYWDLLLGWKGWERLFPLPLWGAGMVFAVCCGGLIWVFVRGKEMWWPSYFLYGLSTYSLTAICVRLPGAVRREKCWMADHPCLAGILKNEELKFTMDLCREQIVNFGYGIYKIVTGVVFGSAWIGADGIYNLT